MGATGWPTVVPAVFFMAGSRAFWPGVVAARCVSYELAQAGSGYLSWIRGRAMEAYTDVVAVLLDC